MSDQDRFFELIYTNPEQFSKIWDYVYNTVEEWLYNVDKTEFIFRGNPGTEEFEEFLQNWPNWQQKEQNHLDQLNNMVRQADDLQISISDQEYDLVQIRNDQFQNVMNNFLSVQPEWSNRIGSIKMQNEYVMEQLKNRVGDHIWYKYRDDWPREEIDRKIEEEQQKAVYDFLNRSNTFKELNPYWEGAINRLLVDERFPRPPQEEHTYRFQMQHRQTPAPEQMVLQYQINNEEYLTHCTDADTDCAICSESVNDGVNFSVKTTCNHCFHYRCLNRWVQRTNTCPKCRSIIDFVYLFAASV